MCRYIEVMTKSRLVPFTCYNLELSFEHDRRAGMCRWFFFQLGKSVHRLRIEQVESVTVELTTLYRVIFEWTPNLVHLELVLVLGPPGVQEDDEGWPGKYPPPEPTVVRLSYLPALKSLALVTDERIVAQEYHNFLVRITQHAVGLEELRLERHVQLDYITLHEYYELPKLQLLPAFRSRNACASLRKLEIGVLTAEDLNILVELSLLSTSRLIAHLQLCELEVQSNTGDLELMVLLYELLKTQASTLTALTIDVRRVDKPAAVARFPFLGQLRRLALLNGANEDDPPVQFDEPSFELNFPKLEELDFCMNGDLRTLQIPHFGIRRLILRSDEGSYHEPFLNELFPSAESVKLCFNCCFDSMQWCWTGWTNVRRIEVEVSSQQHTPRYDPLNYAMLYFLTGSRSSARKIWPRFSDLYNKEEGIELARLARLRTNWPGLPIQEFCLSAEATCKCRSAFCPRAKHEGFKIHWT